MPNSWGGYTAFEEKIIQLLDKLVEQGQYRYYINPWKYEERYRVDVRTGAMEVWVEGDEEVGMQPRWEMER